LKPKATGTLGRASLTAIIFALLPGLTALAVSVADPVLQQLRSELKNNKRPSQELTDQLGQFLEKNPTNYQAHLLMGDYYDRLGLYDQAIGELRLAIQYGPDDPAPISRLIRLQMTLGRNETTPALLQQAEQRFPGDPGISYLRGDWLLFKTHDGRTAEMLFHRAASSGAKIPGLHLSLAQVALAKKDYAEAIKECNEELKQEPDATAAQLAKGLALAKTGQFVAALAPLQAAYSLAQYKLRPDLARTYALAAYWNGKFEDAIEPSILQLALTSDISPANDDDLTKRHLAECLRRVPRQRAESWVAATTANIDRNPKIFKDGSFHRTVADVLAQVGMHRQAVAEYQACLKRNPEDANALIGVAKEFETNFPDYKFALVLYQRARLLRPDMVGIDNLITRLDERIAERDNDLAAGVKEWLRKSYDQLSTKFGALFSGLEEKPKADNKLQSSENTR
jgi:tetratricopeptide (TPR) repeat protein